MIMMEFLMSYLFLGFFFIASILLVYLNVRRVILEYMTTLPSHPEYGLRSASRYELTDAETELVNVKTFAQLCSAYLSAEAYRSLLTHELRTDVDSEALNTLVSLGIYQEDAQFICNYFLAQNLEYPGDLIVLSSQTPLYIYSHDYAPSSDRIGRQIYALWKQEHHWMIPEKKAIYYYYK